MSDNKKENQPNAPLKEAVGNSEQVAAIQVAAMPEERKEKPPLTPAESVALEKTVSKQESANVKALNAQKRVRILIPAGRSKPEQCPVMVGVNGRDYLIERGVEVAVPESVVHVLNLAVEQAPVMDGERVTGFRAVPRYPVQVLGEQSPHEAR